MQYVKMKERAAAEAGFHSVGMVLPADVSQDELIRQVLLAIDETVILLTLSLHHY